MNKYGITLLMSNLCNNNCKYCYQDRNEKKIMSFLQFKKIIEYMEKDKDWNKSITFFGGEPMLSNNLIRKIVTNYLGYNYQIITNGFFLNEDDYMKYFANLENVSITISLEGTLNAHNYFRNKNNNYKKMLERIIQVSKLGFNININMSINKIIFDEMDEFIKNADSLLKNKINIHFYTIKGEDLIENTEFLKNKLIELKKKNLKLYHILIRYSSKKSDTEFLCSFDNNFTIDSSLNVISCTWDNTFLGNLNKDNLDSIKRNFLTRVAYNHKSLWNKCNNCEINVGDCQISCVPYIMELLNNQKANILNIKCNIQQIINKLKTTEEKWKNN